MSGTTSGGIKARDANLKRNPNFYREIGRLGGKAGTTGGFFANKDLASRAGAKGGRIAKRGSRVIKQTDKFVYYMDTLTGRRYKVSKEELGV